eukprot:s45_g33.t1
MSLSRELGVLQPGCFAIPVVALESSRLSRELEATLYSVDWGMRGLRMAEVRIVEDVINEKGENVTDGEGSIGYALAEVEGRRLIPVWIDASLVERVASAQLRSRSRGRRWSSPSNGSRERAASAAAADGPSAPA